jgi:hypothetical protein
MFHVSEATLTDKVWVEVMRIKGLPELYLRVWAWQPTLLLAFRRVRSMHNPLLSKEFGI